MSFLPHFWSKDGQTMNQSRNFYELQGTAVVEIDPVTGVEVNSSNRESLVPQEGNHHRVWKWNPKYGDIILQLLIGGKSLTKISKMAGMPSYSVINRWRAEIVEFDDAVKKIKVGRAEMYRDMIADSEIKEDGTLEKPLSKDSVPGAKLQFEKLKYLAAIDDPSTYSEKSKTLVDASAPIQIVVNTGITRDKPDIVVETKEPPIEEIEQ